MKFLKQPAHIRYVIEKLSNFVKITCPPPQIPFYRGLFKNKKGLGTSFWATFFIKFFDKNFSSLILYKLAKFLYQIVLFH